MIDQSKERERGTLDQKPQKNRETRAVVVTNATHDWAEKGSQGQWKEDQATAF